MRFLRNNLIILLSFICATFCVACANDSYLMEDYDGFINNPPNFEDENSGDGSQSGFSVAKEIAGLGLIGEYEYEGGIDFFGNFTFVTENNEVYLLKNDGTISKFIDGTSRDIVILGVKYDKIIGKINEKQGVIDLTGNILVNFEFDYIDIFDDVILARTTEKGYVYKNNVLVGEVNKDSAIINKDFILSDGKYYNVNDLSVAKIGENFIISAPHNDVVRIVDKDNNYGFAKYSTGEIIISPQYQLCDVMKENVFCAYSYGSDDFGNFMMEYPKLMNAQNELVLIFL